MVPYASDNEDVLVNYRIYCLDATNLAFIRQVSLEVPIANGHITLVSPGVDITSSLKIGKLLDFVRRRVDQDGTFMGCRAPKSCGNEFTIPAV